MEPVTHILTGVCLSRTGLNRRAAYTALTLAIAAELPDIDTLWSLKGPVESFTHHRGITHTLVGLPFEAALLIGAVWLLHRWRLKRHSNPNKPLTAAPVRWGLLYGFALLGLLSHLLLDYTNNYGIRPFFPFNPRWYAASIVFIVDPIILLLLITALIAPLLFGLIGSEVGTRRSPFRGRGWAIAALLGIVSLWTLRAFEHQRALDLTLAQTLPLPAPTPALDTTIDPTPAPAPTLDTPTDPSTHPDAETTPAITPAPAPTPPPAPDTPTQYTQPLRALASPSPFNPWRWTAVADLGTAYQLAEVDLRNNAWSAAQSPLPKPPHDPANLAAYRSPLGRAYFDWSPMPIVSTETTAAGNTLVTLRDPRFMGGWLKDSGTSALTATILIRPDGSIASQAMDGRAER